MEERLLKYFRDHEAEIFGDLERLFEALPKGHPGIWSGW